MAALGVSAGDIQQALRENNVSSTFGRAKNTSQQIDLVANTEAKTPEDFAGIIIKSDADIDIRLSDVAMVEAGSEEVNQLTRYSLFDVVFIGIYPAPGAN